MDYEREWDGIDAETTEDVMENEAGVNMSTGEVSEAVPMGTQVMVFGTTDLDGIVSRATDISNRLKDIVEKAQLYSMIKDKKYVKAEGWTAMCAMLGVFPSADYCRKVEREDEICYEARIVLRHISGNEVGAGEAICSSKERNWGGRDEFAIKSMAQTRATGKACRLSFSWIMALAGYQVTPSEEMINDEPAKTVAMPKSRQPVEAVLETKHLPAESNQGSLVGPGTSVAALGGPRPLTAEEEERLAPPTSKFFSALQKEVRERGISAEKMKRAMKELYGRESSKELLDMEAAALIRLIQRGGIK